MTFDTSTRTRFAHLHDAEMDELLERNKVRIQRLLAEATSARAILIAPYIPSRAELSLLALNFGALCGMCGPPLPDRRSRSNRHRPGLRWTGGP